MINVLRREALEREAELERAREERRVKRADISPERVAELRGADEILTAREAGVILKLSRKTVIELMGKGELPGRKIGNSWRVSKKELMERCRRPPQQGAYAADSLTKNAAT
jgi:excisionase family DNA binding protein